MIVFVEVVFAGVAGVASVVVITMKLETIFVPLVLVVAVVAVASGMLGVMIFVVEMAVGGTLKYSNYFLEVVEVVVYSVGIVAPAAGFVPVDLCYSQ